MGLGYIKTEKFLLEDICKIEIISCGNIIHKSHEKSKGGDIVRCSHRIIL